MDGTEKFFELIRKGSRKTIKLRYKFFEIDNHLVCQTKRRINLQSEPDGGLETARFWMDEVERKRNKNMSTKHYRLTFQMNIVDDSLGRERWSQDSTAFMDLEELIRLND